MRKILRYACLPLAVLSLMACNKDEETPDIPGEMQEVTLDITVSDIKDVEARLQITPDNNDVPYYWNVMAAEEYSAIDGADALYENDMTYFQQLADDRGVSVDVIVSEQTVSGTVLRNLTGLTSETDYVVYGYALTSDGHGSNVSTESFTTLDGGAAEEEAKVKVQIGEARMTQVDVTYTPDDMNVTYYPDYIDDATYQSYGGDIRGVIEYFNETLQYSASLYQVTVEELVATLINRGVKEVTYDYLIPSTTYWFFVAEIDEHGEVLSMDCQSATTTERIMSGVTIDVDIDSVGQTMVRANVHPSDPDEPYYMALFAKADFDNYGGAVSDEAFMQYVVERVGDGMSELAYTGDQEGYVWGLQPDTEYILVAFTCDETWTSELFTDEARTNGVVDPEDFKVDITFPYLSEVQIKAILIPNDNMVTFHYHFMPKEEFDSYATVEEAVQADFNYYIKLWQDYYAEDNFTREEVIGYLGRRGAREYTETQLSAGTDYVLWAAAFSATGELLSPPSVAEFSTLPWHTDESVIVEPILGDYYDGGEIHRFYDGYIFQIFEGIKVENASTWYVGFFKGDYTSEGDDWFAAHNIMSGNKDLSEKTAILLTSGDWTVSAIGQDADGNWGPVWKTLISVDESSCADPSTFPQELLDEHGMLKSPAQYTPSPLRVPEMEPQMTVPEAMPQVLPSAVAPTPVRTDARMSGPDRDTFHIFRIPSDETGAHDIFSFRME